MKDKLLQEDRNKNH